jgi:serine/threonine-protein phosphatase 5
MRIFKTNGVPSEKNMYLFNGGFVNHGPFGLEVMLTLLAYKLLYPNSFYLNRGKHETNSMNKCYGFKREVETKFSETMFKLFSEMFSYLPLAHLINKKIMVVHGGLPGRDEVTLDKIKSIFRFSEAPTNLMYDLLWAGIVSNIIILLIRYIYY